ncbi:MAG: MmgE/PrpD family protein [Proteobacteria bacterium]|jgi:2-methylcitrate dehydratase PrpD|nr:MmgE/PrpD family protein [Pseudomonadota bacterium]
MIDSLTSRICRLALDTSLEDIPTDVLSITKACLLDSIGVGLAGANEEAVTILAAVLTELGGNGTTPAIGQSGKYSIADSALLNGTAIHALDFDDMHLASSMHPSAPVFGAALAVASHTGASGRTFLRACALGLEISTRIGGAVNPPHYSAGWHATGTLGHFGATIASGLLLKLSRPEFVHALGIAGTHAAGLKASFGTMAKPLHAGHAARNGVMAALLAKRGFTASEEILTGEKGFGSVMAGGPVKDTALEHWGASWSVRDILFKPHASSFCTQALIQCMIDLRNQHHLSPEDVVEIRARVSPMALANAVIDNPRTGLEGKFSHTFAAAVGLVHGQATLNDFTNERIQEDQIQRVRSRTRVHASEDLRWPMARVDIEVKDKRTLTVGVDLEERMKTAEQKSELAQRKFETVTVDTVGMRRMQNIRDSVACLEAAPSVDVSLYTTGGLLCADDTEKSTLSHTSQSPLSGHR